MKFICIIFLILSFSDFGFAQISELPKMKSVIWFETDLHYCEDILIKDKLRDNGKPFVLYRNENDTIIREEYFKSGRLKSIAQITQEFDVDTMTYYDDHAKEVRLKIRRCLYDVPNGNYSEYSESGKLKCTGSCINLKRINEWTFYISENKIIANFNNDGEYEGPYFEYYFNSRDSLYTKKVEGEFGSREIETHYKSRKTGESWSYITNETRRVGVWKYYSKNGKLLEKTEYNWQ